MSTRELRRAEVLGRVKGQTLRLVDAAKMLEVSYRQAKRLWQRYREEGAKGLQHRSAGRSSNRAKPEKFRRKVLRLIREKYSGTEQERFGPTLAAEHLADEDGLEVGFPGVAIFAAGFYPHWPTTSTDTFANFENLVKLARACCSTFRQFLCFQ
jgi:transposase